MRIYVAHTTKFNFQDDLYEPLKKISGIEFIFPHEGDVAPKSSKEIIKKCSLMIAEVTRSSLGTGIEIGWADSFNLPIIFLIKKGNKIKDSLRIVSDKFIEYDALEEELENIEILINKLSK